MVIELFLISWSIGIHEVTSLTSDYEDAMIVTNVWFLYYDEIDYIGILSLGCGLVTYRVGKGGG